MKKLCIRLDAAILFDFSYLFQFNIFVSGRSNAVGSLLVATAPGEFGLSENSSRYNPNV